MHKVYSWFSSYSYYKSFVLFVFKGFFLKFSICVQFRRSILVVVEVSIVIIFFCMVNAKRGKMKYIRIILLQKACVCVRVKVHHITTTTIAWFFILFSAMYKNYMLCYTTLYTKIPVELFYSVSYSLQVFYQKSKIFKINFG